MTPANTNAPPAEVPLNAIDAARLAALPATLEAIARRKGVSRG